MRTSGSPRVSADAKVDGLQRALENRAITVLARQQPVATDLRLVVTSLRMSADLERCGDLAEHVAKLARMRYPQRRCRAIYAERFWRWASWRSA